MSVGILFTAVLSIICMLLSRRFLILINTPDEILDMSTGYLQIVFGGLLFTFLYNIYAGTMRSIGDTTTEVARLGIIYLRTMAFFYILPGMTNGLQGYMRGWGKMNICLASTFVQIVGRVAAAAILIPRFQVAGISYSCLVGWLCMLSFEIPFYLRLKKTEYQILGMKDKEVQGNNEQTVI